MEYSNKFAICICQTDENIRKTNSCPKRLQAQMRAAGAVRDPHCEQTNEKH
jgi:hypothetical protein